MSRAHGIGQRADHRSGERSRLARRSRLGARATFAALGALAIAAAAREARASTGLDSPENGVVQVGRGGAWLARADDPLAAYYNPAALAFQPHGVHVGAHLLFYAQCFTRLGADGQPVSPGQGYPGPGQPGGPAAEVCADVTPFPNPQLAASFRLHPKVAIGLAVLGPHAVGKKTWPESLPYTNQAGFETSQPAPQRYLLIEADALLVNPTLSASVAITDQLAVGAGFVWGIASFEFVNFAEAISDEVGPTARDDFFAHKDVRARLDAKDLFVPGFVLSTLWSPSSRFDVAGWFKWQDAVRATGNLRLNANYWNKAGTKDEATEEPSNTTDEPEAGTVKLSIPMEARLGFRYHHPRATAAARPSWVGAGHGRVRDPMSEDLFDVEIDLTWANNSAVDRLELCFGPNAFDDDPGCAQGPSGIEVIGAAGGNVPANGDVPHEWKDVLGVRLGADVVPIANRLTLRAGGFFESQGQSDEYLNLDFHLGWRLGVGGGATVRVGPVDISAAYQHTFVGPLDNGGKGVVRALSGDGSRPDFRSGQAVNGGRLTSSLNEIALGATARF